MADMRYPHLGSLRFFLSLLVMLFHLWPALLPCAGRFAVISFFCISGFLICKIACEYYAQRPLAFLANRFLRIYPIYLGALCTSLCILLFLNTLSAQRGIFPYMDNSLPIAWPNTAQDWLVQFTLFGQYINIFSGPHAPHEYPLRLIPPAWSLNVELFFYLIIGLFTYRSIKLTAVLFVLTLGMGLAAALQWIPLTFYGNPLGCAFTFFAGALTYFVSRRVHFSGHVFYGAFVTYALLALGLHHIVEGAAQNDLMLFLPWSITLLLLLSLPRGTGKGSRLEKCSAFLGEVSYPLFLTHSSMAMLTAYFTGRENAATTIIASALSLLLSAALVVLVGKSFDGWRAALRKTAQKNGGTQAPVS